MGISAARTQLLVTVAAVVFVLAGCSRGSEPPATASSDPERPESAGIDIDASWVQVAPSPLSGRYHAALTSLPDGALMVGGTDDLQCPSGWDCDYVPEPPLRDGARYNALDGSWTPIADAPVGIMVWTDRVLVDDRVFFWVPVDGDQVVEGGSLVAYDLARDRWESFELPPVKGNSRITIRAVGHQLLAGQQTREDARGGDWMLDPATGNWTALPPDPLGPSQWRSFAADETGLYLFETLRDDEEPRLIRGAVLETDSLEWRRIADSSQLSAPIGSVGGVLLHPRIETADGGSVNGWDKSYPYGGIYDPALDKWRELPNTPPGEHQFAAGVIASDDQLISHYRNWMLNWETDTWHEMPNLEQIRTGSEKAWVDGASFAWAGDGLLVVGGVIWDGADGELRNDAWIWRPRGAGVLRPEPPSAPHPTSGDDSSASEESEPQTGNGNNYNLDNPPSVIVLGEVALNVSPFTYCWSEENTSGCADGALPDPLPNAGHFAGPVRFSFPLEDWTWNASMTSQEGASGGGTTVRPTDEPGVWEIEPAGSPGPAVVVLQGRGAQGEVNVAFAVDMTVVGPEPEPVADFAAFFGELDGRRAADLTSEELAGAEVNTTHFGLTIVYLADDTAPAATVRVVAANGAEGSVKLGPHQDGEDPEGNGSIALQSSQAEAQDLLALGPPPFRFFLDVAIGGTTHSAEFVYPDDLNSETTSFQPAFEPALPARLVGHSVEEGPSERYSVDELLRGVDAQIEDGANAIESAKIFLPDDLPSYLSFHPALEEYGVAVMQPGEGGYDVVVIYRSGPYCGLLPQVAVTGDAARLEVAITTRDGGDCDAMEYDAAVGLNLRADFNRAAINASQSG